MGSIPKMLIAAGIVLILAGLLWSLAGRFLPLGKLPGDIAVEKEHVKFYFPIVTCLVVSVLLSLVMYVIRLFFK
ncbi:MULTISPECIES: DUF2905 domain-containing protein [Paenibacillus]|uniref:DUF2905 domain-containing protein n=1 Tax=Paenibacillus TaxID=44249 RepID=UPI0022B911B8|nr:DUF2905 domain-containing protein [Paenibacillus caseinilyticus]MCZ8521217.1 DUF2905 domain-containing protein [Paenibacillus caseinilyticus]